MAPSSTTPSTAAVRAMADSRPWVERYRPVNLDQVSHQTEIVATLKDAVATGRLPHLLLYGPPGSGKTSVALALCRQLWPPADWKRRVLELNASDERGISVVRDKIKHFASLAVSSTSAQVATAQKGDDSTHDASYPNPPFKIIILDEADTVTADAQAALRRIIEAFSRTTRFILICNYVTRIIEPLASRCAKFRFQALPPETMRARLLEICDRENMHDHDRDAIVDDVLRHSMGDMRKAVTTLQSLSTIPGANVREMAGTIPNDVVDAVWLCMTTSKRFDVMAAQVEDLVTHAGYSAQTLLTCLLDKLLLDDDDADDDQITTTTTKLSEVAKASIAIRLAEAEKNMIEGADEYLQLLTVGSMVFEATTLLKASNG